MSLFQKIRKKIYTNKIKALNIEVETEQDKKIIDALFFLGKNNKGREHQLKCFETAALTLKLQKLGELCGRKECGRVLQKKPFVVQCHFCQKQFTDEKNVSFAGEKVINLGSEAKIFEHVTTCEGIICDCGKKVMYFDKCKICGLDWDKRSIYYLGFRKDYPFSNSQKKQIEKYKSKFRNNEFRNNEKAKTHSEKRIEDCGARQLRHLRSY